LSAPTRVRGGNVETLGIFALTTVTVDPTATFYYSSEGNVTTLANNGGTVDSTRQSAARTIATYTPKIGAVLKQIGANITVTNWTALAELHTVTYS